MKVSHRICSLILSFLLLFAAAALWVMPAAAADDEGLTFTEYDLYKPVKTYAEAPNTFEAWIKLPKGMSGRAGVIVGNYGVGNSVINFGKTK